MSFSASEIDDAGDLYLFIQQELDNIYVRHQAEDGSWDSVSLSELPQKVCEEHVARFLKEGVIPVVFKEPEED